jgi:hypothetical protein
MTREQGPSRRREERRTEGETGGKPGRRRLGPGAVGAWTEEELARLPPIPASAEEATRDEDNPEVMRRGEAIEGRRKAVGALRPGMAEPYGDWERLGGETPGRRGRQPEERETRRGRKGRGR